MAKLDPVHLSQVAAIPIRRTRGAVEVMLVTSRETHRWVVPKGWPLPKQPDYKAAAAEAWEEAGVRGAMTKRPLGSYHYDKRRKGEVLPVTVSAYVLEVTEEASSWPEITERNRAWFTLRAAADAVCEPELKEILLGLAKPSKKAAQNRLRRSP